MANSGTQLTFTVVDRQDPSPLLAYPFVELRWDHWDDFKFKTMLGATLFLGADSKITLGNVKILRDCCTDR